MPSPDIAARTAPFLRACLDCMGGNLVGVYLHGSAAMGCFHPARRLSSPAAHRPGRLPR